MSLKFRHGHCEEVNVCFSCPRYLVCSVVSILDIAQKVSGLKGGKLGVEGIGGRGGGGRRLDGLSTGVCVCVFCLWFLRKMQDSAFAFMRSPAALATSWQGSKTPVFNLLGLRVKQRCRFAPEGVKEVGKTTSSIVRAVEVLLLVLSFTVGICEVCLSSTDQDDKSESTV